MNNTFKNNRNAYADFLNSIPWTHVVTFTTNEEKGAKAIRRLAEKIGKQIKNNGTEPHRIKMFWFAERADRDGYHLHCLLYCPQPGEIGAIIRWYNKTIGWCKPDRFNNAATRYILKQLHQPGCEYDFIIAKIVTVVAHKDV